MSAYRNDKDSSGLFSANHEKEKSYEFERQGQQDKKAQQDVSKSNVRRQKLSNEHPLDAASLISKIFFGWMLPFIWLGWRSGLKRADLPNRPSKNESCLEIGEKLVANWSRELESCSWSFNSRANSLQEESGAMGGIIRQNGARNEAKPSLAKAILKTHAAWILRNSFIAFFAEVICKSSSAYSVGQMLWYINKRELVDLDHTDYASNSSSQILLASSHSNIIQSQSDPQAQFQNESFSIENLFYFSWPLLSFSSIEPLTFWTISLILSVFAWALSAHFYGFQMMLVGLHVRVGCSYLIYRKSLRSDRNQELNESDGNDRRFEGKIGDEKEKEKKQEGHKQQEEEEKKRQPTTMGKMVNLVSNDLNKFNHVFIMLPFVWLGPIQTLVSVCLLWPTLGPACFGSIALLTLLIPIQLYLSRKFASFRRRIASFTDKRIQLLNETLSSLKLIKLYGWEYCFQERLRIVRQLETDLINRVAVWKGINTALMYVSSKMVLFVTIYSYCHILEKTLDARTLFMSMAMLNNVQFTMTQLMPCLISLGVDSLISLGRISDFLLSDEQDPRLAIQGTSNYLEILDPIVKQVPKALIKCTGLSAKYGKTNFSSRVNTIDTIVDFKINQKSEGVIRKITFQCEPPGLVIICGQLGSGKSSLLLSLLNELHIIDGKVDVRGTIGYSSQSAWIFGGTIRENITFGQEFDEIRYRRVTEACALKRDFELMQYSDLTYIQEDSLSGGQKARVNLARCLYRDCDIYLLDDPFSAIDQRVCEHIFREAIQNLLADKLVLLVTHQVKLLPYADKILLLDQGKQICFCPFDKLAQTIINNVNNENSTNDNLDNPGMVERRSFFNRILKVSAKRSALETGSKKSDDHYRSVRGQYNDRNAGEEKTKTTSESIISIKKSQEEEEEKHNGEQRKILLPDDRRISEKQTRSHLKPPSIRDEPADEEGSSSANRMSSIKAWCKYYTQTSKSRLILIICTFLITQVIFSTLDIYLTVWSLVEQNKLLINEIAKSNEQVKIPNLRPNFQLLKDQTATTTTTFNNEHVDGSLIQYDKPAFLSIRSPSNRYNRNRTGSYKDFKYNSEDEIHDKTLVYGRGAIPFVQTDITIINGQQLKKVISPSSDQSPSGIIVQEHHGFGNGKNEENQLSNTIHPRSNVVGLSPNYTLDRQRYHYSKHNNDSSSISFQPSTSHEVDQKQTSNSTIMMIEILDPQNDVNVHSNDDTGSAQTIKLLMMRMFMLDRDILEESKAALNVQYIYRPLYCMVNNFNSGQHALTYLLLLVVLFLSSTMTNVLSLTSSNKSAIVLYRKLTDSALFAKLSFFDQNPIGRFINRATRDVGLIDDSIPYNANQAYEALLKTAATFLIVALVNIKLTLPSLIVLFIFLIFHMVHIKPTRDIQRLEGISRSPIISLISTTLNGLQTIRATKNGESYLNQLFIRHQDSHTSVFLLYLGSDRAFSVVLDCLNAFYISLIAVWVVLMSDLSGPSAGLIITSAMLLSGLTQHGLMKLTETESLMTSVERVIEYCSLPQEGGYKARERISAKRLRLKYNKQNIKRNCNNKKYEESNYIRSQARQQLTRGHDIFSSYTYPTKGHTDHGNNITTNEGYINKRLSASNEWPLIGEIEYRQVDFYYERNKRINNYLAHNKLVAKNGKNNAGEDVIKEDENFVSKPVLKNISFKINGGEKIGLIGRTGAGKSSILTTLFRLYDFEGTILIDGIDIKDIDLFELRTSIGIIPQHPKIFSGTIRENLDPFGQYNDTDIWLAIDKSHLRKAISNLPGKLDFAIIGEESNCLFSSGEKQLISLARVLLKQSKVVILDEATANVDPSTDAIIQATIRREFDSSTVIQIAHRIETILDCDRIMILDSGRLTHFDTPEQLVAKGKNYFARLVNNQADDDDDDDQVGDDYYDDQRKRS